jgi:hypothetical protein
VIESSTDPRHDGEHAATQETAPPSRRAPSEPEVAAGRGREREAGARGGLDRWLFSGGPGLAYIVDDTPRSPPPSAIAVDAFWSRILADAGMNLNRRAHYAEERAAAAPGYLDLGGEA